MNGMAVDVRPNPKPRKRLVLRRSEWAKLSRRVRHDYPGCGVCGAPAESCHHAVPRGAGGDDVYDNAVSTCGDGTRGCHGLLENEDPRARERLRDYLELVRPDVLAYIRGRKSGAYLDRKYPRRAA